jgi:hypothetical protein
MIKYLIVSLVALTLGVVTLSAAPAVTTAKVVAVDGNKVQIAVAGEMPAWFRKGAVVKILNEAGEVVQKAARIAEVSGENITLTSSEAVDVKVGDTVGLQKGRITSGC